MRTNVSFISVLPGIPSQYLFAQSQQWKSRSMCPISSKVTKKKPEQPEQITHCSGVFIVENKEVGTR